ncbi:hypothetical protein G4H71_01510 [Rhodococcus triatomae]|uniref:DUF8020 domain-containing protein n=1 Tax=Rhodococcus triatomae TaxID=300028 RepID=A0A1G8DHY4_9NOCA|nr:hypothetical protein [Rhodococcus triatomae]QNG18428.1 hypothetical protein G4H72_06540 [Rhodococcus triatomae]QNG21902.1 hypothetical protein G4H71_01510 [Rhodococcus triatomae]SDH57221.1 hypothetical protein SAMN05444695_102309 [Rhodococcus triatomae]
MFSRKTAATALLSIAALGATAGVAHAEPAAEQPPALVQGEDQGVEYRTGLDETGTKVVTVLDAGVFRLDRTDDVVEVVSGEGVVVGSIPLTYRIDDSEFSIAPLLGDEGRTLTLTPDTDPAQASPAATSLALSDINSAQRFSDELNKASFGGGVGAAIGAAVGLAIGCVVGVFVGCIPGVLIGAAVGGAIGLVNTGGQPLIDAGYQYLTGQP